jgi:hypothetical protein
VADPWSHTVILSWEPTLRFFEQRVKFLRTLEDADLLTAFQWAGGIGAGAGIRARLGASEFLDVQVQQARLDLIGRSADVSAGRRAIEILLEFLEPTQVMLRWVSMQFLVPLAADYDTARTTTASRHFGCLVGPALTPTDWAILLDGYSVEAESGFQVEFGVISDTEGADRVAKRSGRIPDLYRETLPEDVFEQDEYPPCALFLDWKWTPGRFLNEDTVFEDLIAAWDAFAAESSAGAGSVASEMALVIETSMMEAQG